MMEGGSSESEEETNLKELVNEEHVCESSEWFARHALLLKIYNRIMKLSEKDLKKEAAWQKGEKWSVFHRAAGSLLLPFDAIVRLCDALAIDCKDMNGNTAIMYAASIGNHDIVEYLARNKQADLSITDNNSDNVYSNVERNPHTPQEVKEKTYRLLKDNGVTSANIIEGFRSPLSSIDDSRLLPKRLAQEDDSTRFYIRVMTLSMVALEEEAKERDAEHGDHALMNTIRWDGMEVVMERIQRAWPGSVNAQSRQSTDNPTAIVS
jgi:hypothetical protein